MSVTIDAASADRLIAEGAICFDTDASTAVCDDLPVRLPSGNDQLDRPILVCGSADATNLAVVEHLQSAGLPAWLVVGACRRQAARDEDGGGVAGGPEAVGAGAASRAL